METERTTGHSGQYLILHRLYTLEQVQVRVKSYIHEDKS